MSKYLKMPAPELNKIAAERVCGWHEVIDKAAKYAPEIRWWADKKLETGTHNGVVMAPSEQYVIAQTRCLEYFEGENERKN